MSVSLSEIIAGASIHEVPLAGECAGYLVLAAADQTVSAPRRIGPEHVRLHDDGTVRVEGAHAAEETDSEADLRALLDALLLQASSTTPALLRASRRSPGRGIAALVREIETALIPVNRAAAHRALARLERETSRARHSGMLDASAQPAVERREPAKVSARTPDPAPSPAPARVVVVETPSPVDVIPSLLAPEVEAIAALAAEIETRPEPVVARRSAPPPSRALERSPSPPPLPVSARTPSPPPLPVALSTTPVLGTRVQSYSDDEMDIEIVLDDELMEEELTHVQARVAPLEVDAMTEASAPVEVDTMTEVSAPVDVEAAFEASAPVEVEAAPEALAPVEVEVEAAPEAPAPVEVEVEAAPEAPAPVEVEVEAAPEALAPVEVEAASEASAPPDVEPSLSPDPTEPSPPVLEDDSTEIPSSAITSEPHGETLALALSIEPVELDIAPLPRLPMPTPRRSDVEDLLDKMTHASHEAGDELRTSLKGLAGLEPTPPPPET